MTAPHRIAFRVYYEDTDFSGFVYHANYLRFLERARTELLRAVGLDQSRLHQEEGGFVFVVARMKLDFLRPARMDDWITVETAPKRARGVLELTQKVFRGEELLLEADVVVAAVQGGRAVRLPQAVRDALGTG